MTSENGGIIKDDSRPLDTGLPLNTSQLKKTGDIAATEVINSISDHDYDCVIKNTRQAGTSYLVNCGFVSLELQQVKVVICMI